MLQPNLMDIGQTVPQAPTPERKARVLAVDDQRDALRLLQIRLENAGMECFTCSDGASALQFLEKDLVDMVILDVMMPNLDGYEVCRRIKTHERTKDIVVLFLTARFEMQDKIRGLEVGGHDYLTKPVEQAELLARTRSALRVKHLQDKLKEQLHLQKTINQLHQEMLGEHWQKTLGQLAASLAHEINNPLAAALGSVQLLCMDENLDVNTLNRLQIIDSSLQRAGQKLRSLLLIAQNSRHTITVSLAQLLEDLLTMVNFQVVINKINLRSNLPANSEWIGRPSELARALLYLLNNAIEAVGGRPEAFVDVRLHTQGDTHRITIADTGSGIPPELREQVFRPFFTTKPAPHNGVGLYLARELIRSFGGSIQIASPPSGTGTEVIVSLPKNSSRLETPIPPIA
ncbi:MAG TPA: response regulator [Verrucomicrobiae bacterium]|nr:response regulator [Verrucomicrobiae bacterium]